MNEPNLDKIIGSSPITQNTFTCHYNSNSCAFGAHGFISIISASKDTQRHDIPIENNFREVTAISFSETGQHLAVGESGPNARLFVLTFQDSEFDQILSKTVLKTQENGFACIALNSGHGKLITVGNDPQPYLLLWDLTHAQPTCTGYYKLPTVPTNIALSPNCTFVMVSGDKMLKFLDIQVNFSGLPSVLKCVNANIRRFKNSKFVSCGIGPATPYTAFALTSDGIMCYFESNSIPFLQKAARNRKKVQLTISSFNLNRGATSCISIDSKLIVCGSINGSILAVKKELAQYTVFGNFQSPGKAVVAIGITKKNIIASYDDGHIMFWRRKLNSQPLLTLPCHRGPVCALTMIEDNNNSIVTCGSDCSIRIWRIQRRKGIVAKSLQEQICENRISKPPSNFHTLLTGLRCCASGNGYIYTGDNFGNLYILNSNDLSQARNKPVRDCSDPIMCIAIHRTEPLLATGNANGDVRIYNLSNQTISLSITKNVHDSPITSLVFKGKKLITSSSEGIAFMKLPEYNIYATYSSNEPIFSLSINERAKLLASVGKDRYLTLFTIKEGKIFRRHLLSNHSYPLVITTHNSCLIYAIAMSDGLVFIIDAISCEPVHTFQSMAGIITGLIFHEDDLLISSFSGCIMRWNLPESLREQLQKPKDSVFNIFDKPEELVTPTTNQNEFVAPIPKSFMNGQNPLPGWIFKEIRVDMSNIEESPQQETAEEEEEENENQPSFNEPRPKLENQEDQIDNFVRASFVMKSNAKPEAPKTPLIEKQKLLPAELLKPEFLDFSPTTSSGNKSGDGNELRTPINKSKQGTGKSKRIMSPEQLQQVASPKSPKAPLTPSKDPMPFDLSNPAKASEFSYIADNLQNAINNAYSFVDVELIEQDDIAAQNELKEYLKGLSSENDQQEKINEMQKIHDTVQQNAEIAEQNVKAAKEQINLLSQLLTMQKTE